MRWTPVLLVVGVALLFSTPTFAQDSIAMDGCSQMGCCGDQCADTCLAAPCRGGGLIGNVELTFMKYMQEGGVCNADGTGADFNLHCTPRFELGYLGSRNVGFRGRYWYYDDNTAANDGDNVGIDTYYVDAEMFFDRYLGEKTWLECSLGLRYLDFQQDAMGNRGQEFANCSFVGWGGTLGIEAKHRFSFGNLYARGRWSVLLGNEDLAYHINETTGMTTFHDSTSTQTELGVGVEVNRNLGRLGMASVRVGGEWQTWENIVAADNGAGFGQDDSLKDAGFAGVVLRMELRR
ncbi:MAG: hypothetical protein JW888_16090 [Pirellulales bacterium]|nr:hypothetical protein [Pirellulales bacterium]